MSNLILIIVTAALINNVVLSQFLGICFTPWELVMPEVSDLTEREELPKAGPVTGVKS